MKLSIVTVSYRGAEHLAKLLASLDRQIDKDFDLHLINNSVEDGEVIKDLSGKYSFVRFIQNLSNTGFAAGCNIGIRAALADKSDWVLLLNPDTKVEPDFVTKLKDELKNASGIVALPINENGHTVYGGQIAWLKPTLSHISDHSGILQNTRMVYAIGGAVAINRSVIQKIGLINENYFLYFEDVDYSVRVKRDGFSLTYLKHPVVFHAVSASTKKLGNPALLRYHYRNALYFNWEHAPIEYKILIPFWTAWVAAKQIIKIIAGTNRETSIAILHGIMDFHLNNMGRIDHEQEMSPRKIKLGIECENLEDGQSRWGVGHMVLNLLEEYAKNPVWQDKYEMCLYFKHAVPNDPVFQNPIFKKCVLNTGSFNIFYHILLPIRAMRDRLDWVFFPAYMLPPLYFRKSIVMLTNDVNYEYKYGSLPFRYRLAYGLFTNWAAKFATKIMAISEASKKEVAKLYNIDSDKIFVSRLGAKEKLENIKPNVYGSYILYVGQMFSRRSAYESLLAFEKIAPEFPDLKFILVGKDKYRPERIKKEVHRINGKLGAERVIHFEYLEQDEDIASLYAHAKLVVYVSTREAFGLPPIEAAGYGTPVVVKDSELAHELLGEAAFFVENPKNIDEFAAVIREGLTNESKRHAMIEQYPSVTNKLTWQKFAERFFSNVTQNS